MSDAAQRSFVSGEVIRTELEKFYQKPVTRVSVELLLSLITVMFFALFALRPTLTTMSKLVKEIEDKKKVEEALTKKVAALSTAQNEYLTYSRRFGILQQAVHEKPSLDTALYYLEYLVARENLSLAGLRIEEFPLELDPVASAAASGALLPPSDSLTSVASDRVIGAFAVNANFTGDFENVQRFFAALETLRPLFSVQGFTFRIQRDRERGVRLNTSATIILYGYQGATEATGGTPSRTPAPRNNEEEADI